MSTQATANPAGYHSVTSMLTVQDVNKAVDFYKLALGAKTRAQFIGLDGKSIRHAELEIGDSLVMLGLEQAEMGIQSPQTLGGTPVSLYLYVEDADNALRRATAAGAKTVMSVTGMFWGDRCGTFVDPFGHKWSVATRKEDLSQEEIQKRGNAFFTKMARK